MEEGSYLIEYIKIEKSQKLSHYQTNKMIIFSFKNKFYWNSQEFIHTNVCYKHEKVKAKERLLHSSR